MKTFFSNLAGGINQASTKTELGLNTDQIYWSDSENIEILQNKGIIRQKGNVLLANLPVQEKIIAMHQMKYGKVYNLIIATDKGKLFVYNPSNQNLKQLSKTVSGLNKLNFVDFLNGVVVSSKNDALFFIKNNTNFFEPDGRREVMDYIKSDDVFIGKDELKKISSMIEGIEKNAIERYLKKVAYEKNLKNSNDAAKQKLTANAQNLGFGKNISRTFTREQIGKMSGAEFIKNESLIMDQLRKGLIK